jgi:hypothetical protein
MLRRENGCGGLAADIMVSSSCGTANPHPGEDLR